MLGIKPEHDNMFPNSDDEPLDRPIWGAKAIAHVCGEDDERKSFYLCQKLLAEGVITRVGRKLVGTRRSLRNRFAGKSAA
jgi:hypothetical protein